MIQLLDRLNHHLDKGRLPHYFNPACDLLENVPEEERELTKKCVKIILSDPVDAMIKACDNYPVGISTRLGKNIGSWFSPKFDISSIHNRFRTSLLSLRTQSSGECIFYIE